MPDIACMRALEALRNGVPNAYAVRALGCMQPEVGDRFRLQLDKLADASNGATPCAPGMLIAGGFGTGKSHTLAWLEHEALRRNFVVSRLVISKETPLHDPAKIFQAAVREARLPNARGSLLHELATGLDYASDLATPFYQWATQGQPHAMIAASVFIDERSNDAELKEQMVNWWSGEKLTVAQVRNGLRTIEMKDFRVTPLKLLELTPGRFEFAARLARARGFSGWVLLLDEVELIARFSLLQRARAYAELARWIGVVPGQNIPGITAVAAITDDYSIAVLNEQMGKHDRRKAPERLQQKGDQSSLVLAHMATIGIKLIDQESVRLHAPSDDTLEASHGRLRQLYASAYEYLPPNGAPVLPGRPLQPIRSHVRRWITGWDLRRLYGDEGQAGWIEEQPAQLSYDEDPDSMSESDERAEPIE